MTQYIASLKMNQAVKPIFVAVLLAMATADTTGAQHVNPAQNTIERMPLNSAPVAIRCRPDHVLAEGKCVHLRKSLPDIVREILENSEGSSTFLQFHMDASGGNPTSAPDNVPVSDLFIQNLAVISEANMSSCLGLATCNEQCWSWPQRTTKQRAHEEALLEKFIPPPGFTVEPLLSGKSKDDIAADEDDANGPDFVRTIMMASRKGIDLAKKAPASGANWTAVCGRCSVEYTDCAQIQYDYTTRINAIYRQLVEANVTLYDKAPEANRNLSPEVLYYHYSMRFLDLANLTSCYAQVSCENSCAIYKSTLTDESVEAVGPPPSVSPFLRESQTKPKSIDVIHNGALIGYKLALENAHCDQCARHYKDCTADRYEIARASSSIFG